MQLRKNGFGINIYNLTISGSGIFVKLWLKEEEKCNYSAK